jgi:fructokinase
MARLAAVEGGGTTFVVAIASDPTTVLERAEFPTTTPKDTLRKCCEWLASRHYDALGVACFGPLDLKPDSPTFGYITTTPKPGWQQTNVLGPLKAVRPAAPTLFDTDVNAPAVAEYEHMVAEARARGVAPPTSCCYITVGTGIGVGLVINEKPVHGMMHPEGGHMCVPRRAADAGFEGPNPNDTFGGLCAENMGCSVALVKRGALVGVHALKDLSDDDPQWDACAHYLGALCANVVLLASPEKIVMSGGVMLRTSLFPKVRARMQAMLNGYIQCEQVLTPEGIASYVTPSTWGNDAGMVGALTLAAKALEQQRATEKSAGKSAGGGGAMAASGLGERGLLVAGLVVAVLAVAAMRSR